MKTNKNISIEAGLVEAVTGMLEPKQTFSGLVADLLIQWRINRLGHKRAVSESRKAIKKERQ